ncbi:MAG: hypothetical protein ACOYMN_09205 [Roseimicrobium sp.]
MNPDCSCREDAAAWLADELPPCEQAAFTAHLATCPQCRAAVEDASRVLALLRAVPPVKASRDLAPLVLARLRERAVTPRFMAKWPQVAALAALLAVFAGVVGLWQRSPSSPPALADASTMSVARALDWFCRHQESDGSWNGPQWGGNPRYANALTALPLIALLENEQTPERVGATQRAIAYLQRQQKPDGTFGKPSREASFVQSVCTLALLRAYQLQPEPALKRSADAALRVVFATQSPDGGWGNHGWSEPNLPITLWHRDVVDLAAALGWHEARPCLSLATAWLAARPIPPPSPSAGEEPPTDYHHAYFTAVNLRRSQSPEAQAQLAAIRSSLVSRQVEAGEDSGTWQPSDQWSRVGGRIYSTAMALLALR